MGAATSASDERRPHFTFIWAIENGCSLTLGTILSSPVFTVKSMENTKWRLSLHSVLPYIFMYIYREEEDDGPEEIEIDYELSLLGADGLPLIKIADTHTFLRHQNRSILRFEENHDVFFRRRAEFLPRDVLTIRCRMWKKGTETPKPDACFARTRMGTDRHCFVWAIKDFSTLPLGHKTTRQLKSTSEGAPDLTLIFCLKQCDNKIYVCIDIDRGDVTKSFHVKGEISILDAEGAVVHSEKIKRYLDKRCSYLFINFFETQKLLSGKATLLPYDVLSLRCELEVFYGSLWSGIENCAELGSMINTDVKGRPVEESVESVTDSCPFRQNIRRFFEDGIFSDVALRADAETFLVHKIILSSRSPVFKAMFTNDMKEKTSECIDVHDVDAGTLRRLLLYIYMNEVQEMQWDKTADLFRAADKYELLELKKQCSAILKWNISRSNVCCILSLADMHHDEDLRKAVLDYISKNLDIFNSKIWKIFKRENSGLAMETMERIAYSVSDSNQIN
ncbi:TD and POZ domain-containing protein 4 [Araneus ventricosus]|uniref:TD and POZ domain-containing protein 4 n=1 Tax=Araneus ventricosus TaxID=182803 RepID=A0A4Y2KWX2_ARAVE|nr:TD and POZ domain-containing protein 4 [Araneus ventricosus]